MSPCQGFSGSLFKKHTHKKKRLLNNKKRQKKAPKNRDNKKGKRFFPASLQEKQTRNNMRDKYKSVYAGYTLDQDVSLTVGELGSKSHFG